MKGRQHTTVFAGPRVYAAALAALCALCAFVPTASAAYLDCLERSEGKTLTWDGRWVRSTSDQDVEYRITGVRIKNVMPDRFVTLKLSALTPAEQSKRTLTVETEEKARRVCERIRVEKGPLRFPNEIKDPFATSSGHPQTMPYIEYSRDGWVRGKMPVNAPKLAICRVHDREFSCLEEEKNRYGIMLRAVEEEIRWSGE